MYGGAAGGGKSDAGLMGAAQYVCVPGYNAVLFRQTYGQLAQDDGLIERSQEWFADTGATYNQGQHRWTFPSGASITFGALQYEADRHKWQGAAFQYAFFDELTNFPTDRGYRYLFSRLRRPKAAEALGRCPTCGLTAADVPLRMRSGTNPGGAGEAWVFARLVKPWRMWRDGKGPRPSAFFVPARLQDNAWLDWSSYMEMLAELDPVEQARLLHGEWDIRTQGGMFDRTWFSQGEPPPEPDGREVKVCRYWDKAGSEDEAADFTAGAKVVWRRSDNRYWIVDIVRLKAGPGTVERTIKQTAIADGYRVPIVIEQEPGSAVIDTIHNYRTRVLRGYSLHGDKVTGAKEERASNISAAAYARHVHVVPGAWNEAWYDECEPFPNPGVHDDQVDAVSGAANWLSRPKKRGGLRA